MKLRVRPNWGGAAGEGLFLKVLIISALFSGGALGQDIISIKDPPTKAKWQSFMQLNQKDLVELWQVQRGQGVRLKNWAWQWRIGWVKVCIEASVDICDEVLAQAMGDRALVVRAEAVKALRLRFAGSADENALSVLQGAFGNKRNYRNHRPLFILSRILFAIYEIGGEQAMRLGKDLAKTHPKLGQYWQELIKT